MKTTFVFVRHGESVKNINNITGGEGKKLTIKGIAQANEISEILYKKYSSENVLVITSNVIQAIETAEIISKKFGTSFQITDRLKAADLGVVGGLSVEEIQKNYPYEYNKIDLWHRGIIEASDLDIKGMEPPGLFWNRIIDYINELCDGQLKIIVCTRSVLVLVKNFVMGNTPMRGGNYKHHKIDNCETIEFCIENGMVYK